MLKTSRILVVVLAAMVVTPVALAGEWGCWESGIAAFGHRQCLVQAGIFESVWTWLLALLGG